MYIWLKRSERWNVKSYKKWWRSQFIHITDFLLGNIFSRISLHCSVKPLDLTNTLLKWIAGCLKSILPFPDWSDNPQTKSIFFSKWFHHFEFQSHFLLFIAVCVFKRQPCIHSENIEEHIASHPTVKLDILCPLTGTWGTLFGHFRAWKVSHGFLAE